MKTLGRTGALCLAIIALCAAAAGAADPAPPQPPPGSPAPYQGFSFFGVRFGMPRSEVEQKWLPLSDGSYAVSQPAIKKVRADYDFEGKVYQIIFSVELDFPHDPPAIVNRAFQDALEERWKKDPGLTVNVAMGKDSNQVTVIHNKLRDEYVRHLQDKIAEFFRQ